MPSYRDLATGRRWHFFRFGFWSSNGLVLLIGGLLTPASGEGPHSTLGELHPWRLAAELWHHLKLQFHGAKPRATTILCKNRLCQRRALGRSAAVLNRTRDVAGVDAAAPFLLDLFGGRQRPIAAFHRCDIAVLFVVVHLSALLAVGVWKRTAFRC